MTDERELLEMALAGYALKREAIEREIERVRLMLKLASSETLPVGPGGAEWPVKFVSREQLGRRAKRRAKREKARKGGRG